MTLTIMEPPKSNGELPESRKAAIQQGLEFFQETAAERDRLQAENAQLRVDLAGYKVVVEAKEELLNQAESRINSALLARDQAIAERAKYETLFASFKAQLNAFAIPAAPYIRDRTEDENLPTIGGA